jgi:hypothetical protein
MANHRRDRAGANRQVGEERFDFVSIQRRAQQVLQRLLDQRAAILPGDDQAALDLAGIDHGAERDEPVEEAETRIRNVENLAVGAQANLVVGKRGRGRFEHIARHRAMHERLDLIGLEPGPLQDRPARLGTGVGWPRARRPLAAFANPRH